MSTVAISTITEAPITESHLSALNDSLRWADVQTSDDHVAHTSGPMENRALCYRAASEVQLVAAAKSGDQHAFAELCRRYIPSLKPWIRRIIRNREDAEDILQDTLLSAYKHLSNFQSKSSFRTWMMTIATNNSLMLLRKRQNRPEIGLTHVTPEGKEVEFPQLFDPMPDPEQVYAKQQACQRVCQAVRRLPPGFRQLVEHYHQDEVRLVDAANAIGITESAAKSRLLRARNVLRRHLKNDYIPKPDRASRPQ